MRILRVRFKNLNSLVGEWAVDFSHPAFTSEGIAAITGPTGAGKSTILDAVSLALYGRTPRLSRVNKSGNEIISRRTGDCFAEVDFATSEGSFRCHWSQRRARKSPCGELQPPRQELSNVLTGEILAAKIHGVAEHVEAVTGMDFDRFTRTMFLAQGGFAAFLLAAPDERAPILEQITGTEIYSRISMRVHERYVLERKTLEDLQARLDGMRFLAPDEEQAIHEALAGKKALASDMERQIAEKGAQAQWLEGIALLEDELRRIALLHQDWQRRMEDFAPEREKLRLSAQALELAGIHSELALLRQTETRERQNLAACREKLPAAQAAVAQAEKGKAHGMSLLEAIKAELRQETPGIRKARELDLRILEKSGPLGKTWESIRALELSLQSLQAKHARDLAELAGKRERRDAILAAIQASAAEQSLVEQLAGIRGQVEALEQLKARHAGLAREMRESETRYRQSEALYAERARVLAEARQSRDAMQASLAAKRQAFTQLLGDKSPADLRDGHLALLRRESLLARAGEAAAGLARARQALEKLHARHSAISQEISLLAAQIPEREKAQAAREQLRDALEEQWQWLQKVAGLEQERARLQDGEPCPLCGAREHPFAEGGIPLPDERREDLERIRQELKEESAGIAALAIKLAAARKDLEQAESLKAEHAQASGAAAALLRDLCPELNLLPDMPDLPSVLGQELRKNTRDMKQAEHLAETVSAMERDMQALQSSLDKLKEAVLAAEAGAADAEHKKQLLGQALERLRADSKELELQRENAFAALSREVRAYGVENPAPDALGQLIDRLSKKRDAWLTLQQEKTDIERAVAALAVLTEQQAARIRKDEAALASLRDEHASLSEERARLQAERASIFGSKNPDAEETRLAVVLEQRQQALEAETARLGAAQQELGVLHAKLEEIMNSLASLQTRLSERGKAFLARLEEKGFVDEAAYAAACLTEERRGALMRQAQRLADEKTAILAQESDKSARLEQEKHKRLTEEPLDGIKASLAQTREQHMSLLQEIGGLNRKLIDNEALRQAQRDHLQAVDAQKRECSRWGLLHDIIGSADGKKFRNFAQGLTFEMLIAHANAQLRKMSDRYLLLHDPGRPLELSVIDNYQAGEIRSAKNLSGGESFIVSLSLALGLSRMAGKNARVDSLFLDEGFGSLDEEALDTALETLAGLKQEGKLIVVISHVQALKDRISARIRVTPVAGGKSRISGPGCTAAGENENAMAAQALPDA